MTKIAMIFGCALLFFSAGLAGKAAHAADMFEEMSTPDMLYVRGLISSVSIEKMQISVRPPKEKRVVIVIDPDTIFDGVESIGELEKRQQIKVWYQPGENGNRAVKIKKMMDLGC